MYVSAALHDGERGRRYRRPSCKADKAGIEGVKTSTTSAPSTPFIMPTFRHIYGSIGGDKVAYVYNWSKIPYVRAHSGRARMLYEIINID
jgi:hypothetical protein